MNIEFTSHGWEDFNYWLDYDENVVEKIKELIKFIRQEPFRGIGKPEPLKYGLKGFGSRKITGEHRLVYALNGKKGVDQKCLIIQFRFHYDDR